MSQTYSDKPTLAAWNALAGMGELEYLDSYTVEQTTDQSLTIDLSQVEWSEWKFLIIVFNCESVGGSGGDQVYFSDGSRTIQGPNYQYPGQRTVGPMVGILAPFHDATHTVRIFAFPGTSLGVARYTFERLTSLKIFYDRVSGGGLQPGTGWILYGIR